MEQLTQAQHKAAETLYKQAGPAPGGAGPGGSAPESGGSGGAAAGGGGDVIDAEVVDDEKR
jgi:molecular chaperone DnaK